MVMQPVHAQTEKEKSSNSSQKFQTFIGASKSFALDKNFIGDAYYLKYGVELGGAYLITENFFAGVQIDMLKTEVETPAAIGGIVNSRIVSSSINIGYLLQMFKNLDLSAKLGLGHARYAHKADPNGRSFHDDAFITYLEPRFIYHWDKTFGIYLGFNLRYDKMNIRTSEFYEDYFESSTRAALNLGAQFSF